MWWACMRAARVCAQCSGHVRVAYGAWALLRGAWCLGVVARRVDETFFLRAHLVSSFLTWFVVPVPCRVYSAME